MGRELTAVRTKSGNKLTVKQYKFVKGVVSGKNGSQAVKEAGYKAKDALNRAVVASENIKKPYIQEAIREELDKQGLSISESVDRLGRTIDAGIGIKATNKDSIKGLEMVFKLQGLLDTKKVTENKTLKLSLSVKNADELKEALQGKVGEAVRLLNE
jgi:phage terminase small subunit